MFIRHLSGLNLLKILIFIGISALVLAGIAGVIQPVSAEPSPDCTSSAWNSMQVYTGGDTVSHNGHEWRAKWWTRGEEPRVIGEWGVWEDLGSCSKESDQPGGPAEPKEPAQPEGRTPIETHGPLHVCGTKLCDQSGNSVQLRGMSTHGLQWYGWGNCVTESSLDTLAYDWNADILRVSLYVQEGGYETDPEGFTAQVNRIIEEATERGMYVLVDWHQLTPGDPMVNLEHAKTFFTAIAQQHRDKTNIIYDIANEPNGVSWSRIRDYAHQIIPVIRQHDPDSVILIGTHGWASLGISDGRSARDIVDHPVDAENIMYTFHFYAASHGQAYRDELAWAADRIPIFVTEWGSQEYTGDGPNDFNSTQAYLDIMKDKEISWINWNYSDDWRSGAVWKTGTCSSGQWTADNLKPAGQWVRDKIRNR
ncbi:cellulase family glycosylhydrolase [Desmospora profundinema]|uniref:cellulase n=1 Tax=Desmospora profundinema TaxID=1571184 RepID=A0ABU1IJK2_9BACL|nr:cellulase family glycosylhydrolase [Desmospora profundinema]MDR6224959.1 endoglucanase [Desmospora profundinema]